MEKKKLLVFASGTKDGGGSGFEQLCINKLNGLLHADIVGVASNHAAGGVYEKALRYGIPFFHVPKELQTAEGYQTLVRQTGADFVALSGWLKLITGLDPKTTFNIHPGPLPAFGGAGMYGHHVHEAVHAAYQRGEITHTAVTMHFVTEQYDEGPTFFEYRIKLLPDDTPETIAQRVNRIEHEWQSVITELVLQGKIAWDGADPASLIGKKLLGDLA